jgi:hypothetical protein
MIKYIIFKLIKAHIKIYYIITGKFQVLPARIQYYIVKMCVEVEI